MKRRGVFRSHSITQRRTHRYSQSFRTIRFHKLRPTAMNCCSWIHSSLTRRIFNVETYIWQISCTKSQQTLTPVFRCFGFFEINNIRAGKHIQNTTSSFRKKKRHYLLARLYACPRKSLLSVRFCNWICETMCNGEASPLRTQLTREIN
jgi:hypothetical protein